MSDIKIQPSATGSATVTLTAPATGTARTVTLPDDTGTLLTTTGSAASLTAIPAANITGTFSHITANGSGTSNFTSTATSPVQINGTSIPTLTVRNSTSTAELQMRATTTTGLVRTATNHPLVFAVFASEKMRIEASGKVNIGTTGSNRRFHVKGGSGENVAMFEHSDANGTIMDCRFDASSTPTNGAIFIRFGDNNSNNGSITSTGSGTTVAYNTSSDYRLKENVDYTWDATTRLKQLKPARFNFIANSGTTVDGFLAHEVSTIVPEAVTGEKDAVDDDGNIDAQGIDQSKLVPLLVKTIQELEARITTLEG